MVADFIDFMKHRKKPKTKKLIRLEGVLKGYDIDLSELKKIREDEWRHLEEKFENK